MLPSRRERTAHCCSKSAEKLMICYISPSLLVRDTLMADLYSGVPDQYRSRLNIVPCLCKGIKVLANALVAIQMEC